jgi:threonine aldolase
MIPPPDARPLLPDRALRARCTRFLSGNGPMSPRAWIDRLAASPHLDRVIDEYGAGPAMEELESNVAALLGKEAALFFHKGVVAQQVALLVHAERSGQRTVALHPQCHIAADEDDALARLSGLVPVRVGLDHLPFTAADLDELRQPLAAVTVELPLRNAAYRAPSWDELAAISAWARDRKIAFHVDGARLWEVQPWYGRSHAEIAALTDTIYVSLYKGLEGMAGCVLAGPKALIEEAKPWRSRFGGNLYTAFPFVLTALEGLRRYLPRMAEYHRHATAIAAALAAVPGVVVIPEPPHSNSFQVHFAAGPRAVERAAVDIAKERGIWLFSRFQGTPLPGRSFGEFAAGEATLGWTPDEVAAIVAELLE